MHRRRGTRTRRAGAALTAAALGLVATSGVAPGQTGGVAAPDGGDASGPSATVLVVGDSLAVGMRATFGDMVAPRPVVWDARAGRTTPQGMSRLREELRTVVAAVVVVSLGTNDGTDPHRFSDRLRRVLAAIPAGTCVVWPAIHRPPRKGAFVALNRVLRGAARRDARLVVVDWDREVAAGGVVLPDGLHPDAAGYARRSRMVADAMAARCAPARRR